MSVSSRSATQSSATQRSATQSSATQRSATQSSATQRSATQRVARFALSCLESQDGVVESTLVMVPTIMVFLGVLQIAISGLGHGIATNRLQGDLARGALFQSGGPSTNVLTLPLTGGGSIFYGENSTSNPSLSPLDLGSSLINSRSMAVDENQ